MNSVKPVITGPQPAGQGSPAKANVANVNHAVGHPQGAQNSMNHGTNSMVGQNLSQHSANSPQPHHAIPSMAPVSANMAQMAQNMSHHGNLSQATPNSVSPPVNNVPAPSPTKPAAPPAPLSLVADKPATTNATPTPQPLTPLALTRTPEKKEGESNQANGTIESPKSGTSAPVTLKPQNPETNKEKQDIAKTSPSTPKPPEKVPSVPNTPQKAEANAQAEVPTEPKVATANEVPEKSPAKPTEMKPAQPADVAPTQSDSKPEAAKENQEKVATLQKPVTPHKADLAPSTVKSESPKVEEKKADPIVESSKTVDIPDGKVSEKTIDKPEIIEKPESIETPTTEVNVPDSTESAKIEVVPPKKAESVENKPPESKPELAKTEPKETKTATKVERPAVKSNLKLATVTTPVRKRRSQVGDIKANEGPTPVKKSVEGDSTPDQKSKRNRTKVQLYQSPTPELAMATKLSASAGRSTPTKPNDDKLIVFYKNEYLAVRNAEGGFYVCQTTQNVYRATRKIKIRWLSQDKTADPSGETYKPDFYDVTDMECVLTTLSLTRAPGGGGAQILKPAEAARAQSILNRAIQAEQGGENLQLTEEHPDGLDLSLYKDESQLEKKGRKRSGRKFEADSVADSAKQTPSPAKKARGSKVPPTPSPPSAKRKRAGTAPLAAPASKTATAVTEKPKKEAIKVSPAKKTPVKGKPEAVKTPAKKQDTPAKKQEVAAKKQDTPAKKDTPIKKPQAPAKRQETPAKKQETSVKPPSRTVGRRGVKESKPSPIVPTPSTSTGKTTRTPRKPPAKK